MNPLSRSQKGKMVLLFFFLFQVIFVVAAGTGPVVAPGSQECPPLHVGERVVATHSCTHGSSPPETVCSFSCHKGYQLVGPPAKHCQLDGTWTDLALSVECQDINECDNENGFCGHICKNTPGSFHCACPEPLFLDPTDKRKCKAHGVSLSCEANHMKIALPKNLIHDLEDEHLSLLDPTCKASGNATHYLLSTEVTGCGTASHVYKNFIVYTNRVIESPNDNSDVITTVGKNEILVPFSCYYNDLEIVHAVGFKPVAQKIHVYVQGRGEYALSLDIYKDGSYGERSSKKALISSPKYSQDDFPISVKLRQRVYLEASLDTRETDLKIFASNCCTTPMRDHEATIKFRHALIVEGCPVEPSVQFHATSDPTKVRFSFKVFQFLGDHPYVFVHCRVYVCDVNNHDSRCAKGCIPKSSGQHVNATEIDKLSAAKKSDKKPKGEEKSKLKTFIAKSSDKDENNPSLGKTTDERMPKLNKEPTSEDHANQEKDKLEILKNLDQDALAQPKAKRDRVTVESSTIGAKQVKRRLVTGKQEKEAVEIPVRRITKRALKKPLNDGVLGTGDLSEGPFIFDVHGGAQTRRWLKREKMFVHAKRNGIERDVKKKRTGHSWRTMPSTSNVFLVATTVASILALIGVAILGRKAMKPANDPYDYQVLTVSQ